MSDDRPRQGFWDRLDTPTRVVLAIVGILGGLLGAAATGAAFFGQDNGKTVIVASLPSAVPDRAQRIAACMRSHRLRAARVSVGVPGDSGSPARDFVFKRCDWPALTPGSTDGYTEVRVRNIDLPKGNAAPYNTVSKFRAQCEKLDVTFVLDHMSLRQFTSSRLAVSRIYEVDGVANGSLSIRELRQVPADVDVLIPLPTANPPTFYVLYSGHFALFDAHCATGRPPS
jgi:hypothetical protein